MLIGSGPLQWSLLALFTGIIGVTALAAGVQGWFLTRASWWQRVALIAAALCLVASPFFADFIGPGIGIGIGIVVLVFLIQRMATGKPLLKWGRTPGVK